MALYLEKIGYNTVLATFFTSIEKVGLKHVKTTTVNEKFLRDIYMKKL